mmetsp:Transcript_10071/g.21763  ORF Transcript_10071/g.21763 Transcript_10071/m.21763 type:complete len:230 (+) Transcript_10071:172-861(+)
MLHVHCSRSFRGTCTSRTCKGHTYYDDSTQLQHLGPINILLLGVRLVVRLGLGLGGLLLMLDHHVCQLVAPRSHALHPRSVALHARSHGTENLRGEKGGPDLILRYLGLGGLLLLLLLLLLLHLLLMLDHHVCQLVAPRSHALHPRSVALHARSHGTENLRGEKGGPDLILRYLGLGGLLLLLLLLRLLLILRQNVCELVKARSVALHVRSHGIDNLRGEKGGPLPIMR